MKGIQHTRMSNRQLQWPATLEEITDLRLGRHRLRDACQTIVYNLVGHMARDLKASITLLSLHLLDVLSTLPDATQSLAKLRHSPTVGHYLACETSASRTTIGMSLPF